MGAVRGGWRLRNFAGAAAVALLALGCGRTAKQDGSPDHVPLEWPDLKPNCAVAIDGGCGVYQDGSVWCWDSEPRRVEGLKDVLRVFAGTRHNCALSTTGELLCWGANEYGQIDDSGEATVPPTSPQLAGPQPSPIKAVALSTQQTCVLDFLSHVRCRGFDAGAAQNLGPTEVVFPGPPDTTMPGPEPYLLDDKGLIYQLNTSWADPFVQRDYGTDNAWFGRGRPNCLLKRSGSLWCDSDRSETVNGTMVAVATLGERVTQVALGYGFVCALSEGKVWCQGDNAYGQTATGDTVRAPIHVVEGLDDVRAISANSETACALKGDGSVWCWGKTQDGPNRLSPTQMSGCVDQTAPPSELPRLSTTRPNSAARLAEAGLARAQAMCGCAFQGVPDAACVDGENGGPNQACMEALSPQPNGSLDCTAAAMWQDAECYAKQICTEKGLVQGCLSTLQCPPTPNSPVQYCRRPWCLDEQNSLQRQQICDGAPQCMDGSDERNCQPGALTFECDAGVKLALPRLCDGTSDCNDGSDERFCP